MQHKNITKTAALLGGILASTASLQAVDLRITVESEGSIGGLAPVFTVFHSGNFDPFDIGAPASPGLEVLAEVGDPSVLIGEVTPGADAGAVIGSPILPSGTNASLILDVDSGNPYFQFASMILPSNDWFIGANDPYDITSVLSGGDGASITFNIDASRAYDAGTEEEDFLFSPGNPLLGVPGGDAPGGTATPGQVITGAPTDFSSFLNAPAGFSVDFTGERLARITITNVTGLYGSGAVFDDAVTLDTPGWAFSEAIGAYYAVNFPWIYTSSLGWVYAVDSDPADEGGYFMYRDNTSSWAYSRIGVWPFFHDFTLAEWLVAP